jgi:hypothetical protein
VGAGARRRGGCGFDAGARRRRGSTLMRGEHASCSPTRTVPPLATVTVWRPGSRIASRRAPRCGAPSLAAA